MDLKLRGKKALVTGASKGLGFGIASVLAAEGAQVVINSRNEAGLEIARQKILESTGNSVAIYPADLANPDSPKD
jgi:3-oxoacyl-[acyl-carrier protein] reductase